MKKIILILLLVIGLVNAQGTNVIKDTQGIVKVNEVVEVNININNPNDFESSYEIIEMIPNGFSLIDPGQPDETQQRDAISIRMYKWMIKIDPQKIFTIKYKIKPDEVGEYIIPPTKVNDLRTSEIFLSEPKKILVLCVPNNKCEGNENSFNCPEDCTGDLRDGICNYKADGICDPDCEEEPDCNNVYSSNYLYTVLISLGFLVLIVFIINILKKSKKNEENLDDDKEAVFQKARESVKLFREKGYNNKQVKEEFFKKGWSKEDIDRIFEHI